MIKITPYDELPQKDEIWNLYLYMVAKAVPFYPEDVLGEKYFDPNEKIFKDIDSFKKSPRQRKKKGKYLQLLQKYLPSWKLKCFTDIGNSMKFKISKHIRISKKQSPRKFNDAQKSIEERKKNDALLAEKIIKANSKKLHNFLYEGQQNGHVNHKHLIELLTTSVSKTALENLTFVEEARQADKTNKDELLENVFRYEAFSDVKVNGEIYKLISLMGVEVCPYCNRLFITTIAEEERKMRPELDHYRNKSEYPFFALSIKNMVPSCGVCNHIKSNESREILYPYEEEMGSHFSFRVDAQKDLTALTGTRIDNSELTIKLNQNDNSLLSKHISNSIDILNLKNVYQSHRGYVADLILQRYIFTDEMIKDIAEKFPFFANENEVREMLLLNKLEQEHWGDRPLGKLTHDILEELDILYKT